MSPFVRARRAAALFALIAGIACTPALAHKGSDAYLDVQQADRDAAPSAEAVANTASTAAAAAAAVDTFRLRLAVAVRDLDLVVPVDSNADGQVTWGEVKVAAPQILALLNKTARLEAPAASTGPQTETSLQDSCRLDWQADGLERRSDGVYFRAAAVASCPAGSALNFSYQLLKDEDSTHRLLVAGRIGGKDLLSTLSPQQGLLPLSPGTASRGAVAGMAQSQNARLSSRLSALRDYFSLGMHHLLQGYDHLAFLLALVLPLQLSLRRSAIAPPAQRALSRPESSVRRAGRSDWLALLRTVTAFTVGHSITLILATLGLTQASPVWVEPAIALSIAVTAWLNLRPLRWLRIDVLALLFGMIHGFGFAGLLIEAAAPGGLLPWALAGFNLGVEAGQLLAVAGWVLVSQALVGRRWYGRVVVQGGSVLLIMLAAWWFWQRIG